jgi:hypothetical protein
MFLEPANHPIESIASFSSLHLSNRVLVRASRFVVQPIVDRPYALCPCDVSPIFPWAHKKGNPGKDTPELVI